MLGTIFSDPGAAQELLNNAPRSVLEKIRDFIFELLDTISAAARRILRRSRNWKAGHAT